MAQNHIIVGVHISNRTELAVEVQQILTKMGCSIKTRLGMHDVGENYCSPNGLVLLEIVGEPSDAETLIGELNKIQGVEAQSMLFGHA